MKTQGRRAGPGAEDYHGEALETLDALLAGLLGGGLGSRELAAQFPVIRAALRQIRADLDRAWPRKEEL